MNTDIRFHDYEEYRKFDKIPECYRKFPDDDCHVVAAYSGACLVGIMVFVRSATQKKCLILRSGYINPKADAEALVSDMLDAAAKGLTDSTEFFGLSCVTVNGKALTNITHKLMEEYGCSLVESRAVYVGHHLADIFDCEFLQKDIYQIWNIPQLKGFAECGKKEIKERLVELGVMDDPEAFMFSAVESCSHFYIADDGQTIGAVCAHQPASGGLIVDGFLIKESERYGEVQKELFAAALSMGLEGMGKNTLMFIRCKDEKEKEFVENLLGRSAVPVSINNFKYYL